MLYLGLHNFGPAGFEDQVRWLGIILEALAIGLIAYDLSKTVVTFQRCLPLNAGPSHVGALGSILAEAPERIVEDCEDER